MKSKVVIACILTSMLWTGLGKAEDCNTMAQQIDTMHDIVDRLNQRFNSAYPAIMQDVMNASTKEEADATLIQIETLAKLHFAITSRQEWLDVQGRAYIQAGCIEQPSKDNDLSAISKQWIKSNLKEFEQFLIQKGYLIDTWYHLSDDFQEAWHKCYEDKVCLVNADPAIIPSWYITFGSDGGGDGNVDDSSGTNRTQLIRGYLRANGAYVEPYYRAPRGSGGHHRK